MIENLTKEQMAGVAVAWRVLINDLKVEDRHGEAFFEGRKWGVAHPLDASLAVIEFFCWWIACNGDVKLERSADYFQQALIAEIGETECERIVDMEFDYRTKWISGVVDIFVLAGGELLMDEWNVTTKH
jgi:hypothetical protein